MTVIYRCIIFMNERLGIKVVTKVFHVRVDATTTNQPNHLETGTKLNHIYTWSYAPPIPHVHYTLCTLHQSTQKSRAVVHVGVQLFTL